MEHQLKGYVNIGVIITCFFLLKCIITSVPDLYPLDPLLLGFVDRDPLQLFTDLAPAPSHFLECCVTKFITQRFCMYISRFGYQEP
jgi:hypothetical protein